MIHRNLKWSETANYSIKKNNSRNQNLQGSTMGGGQGSTMISATHVRTPEFTPRGVPILDPSYLRVSIYYAFNVHLLTKSWQLYACLNSQNYHPPHDTPSFMAFPTYKLGCDRHYILVSMTSSTSCQSTLSSTSPWHTADLIDFLFRSSSYAFGFFRTPSLVWQTKYLNCLRAITNFIFNTISFGDNTMLKVGNCHWHTHTHIDSKTAAFHLNVKSNQFCSTRPIFLSWLWIWIRLCSVL